MSGILGGGMICVLLLMGGYPALADCDPGEVVIKFSHVANAGKHPKGISVTRLARRVNREMNGRACMEVFPNSILYNDDKALEALLNNDIQLAAPSLSKFEKFTKQFRIFDLPFLFGNMQAVDKFQNSPRGQAMKESMVERGLLGLAFWHNGLKQFSANTPLIMPEDAKGLKFRVQSSDVLVAQMEALGANPQKMAFVEVYGALQQGVIDGQENTWSNIYNRRFFEVQDGVTQTNHGLLDYLVVTSIDWWDSLDDDIREPFLAILRDITHSHNKAARLDSQRARQAIIDKGSVVRQLTPKQRQAWIEVMQPVWQQFIADVGQETLKAAQAMNKE